MCCSSGCAPRLVAGAALAMIGVEGGIFGEVCDSAALLSALREAA